MLDNPDNPAFNLKNKMELLKNQVTEYSKYDKNVSPIEPYMNDPDILLNLRNKFLNFNIFYNYLKNILFFFTKAFT
jgi:hypothetical protein